MRHWDEDGCENEVGARRDEFVQVNHSTLTPRKNFRSPMTAGIGFDGFRVRRYLLPSGATNTAAATKNMSRLPYDRNINSSCTLLTTNAFQVAVYAFVFSLGVAANRSITTRSEPARHNMNTPILSSIVQAENVVLPPFVFRPPLVLPHVQIQRQAYFSVGVYASPQRC